MVQGIQNHLKEGAINALAALCRTLTPINRIKDALSCSKTYFTVVPVEIDSSPMKWAI